MLHDFQGFGVRGYRSFTSEDMALVGPFQKVHLITGQNNSGKSALADIAFRVLPVIGNGYIYEQKYPFSGGDIPQGTQWASDKSITLSLCFSLDSILMKAEEACHRDKNANNLIKKLFSSTLISHGEKGVCWVDFDLPLFPKMSTREELIFNNQLAVALGKEFNTDFTSVALSVAHYGGASLQDNLRIIMQYVIPWESIPQVVKVEAIRQVTDGPMPNGHLISGGEGLIKELRRLYMPTVDEQFTNQSKWGRFERFIRDVLNDPDAEVKTDAEAKAVLIKSGTPGFLELSDLGTGIEELVMIAAVVACNNNKLILIEEPEIHLHPTLQTKLIQYFLEDKNGNRFLITTHSPSIINVNGVTVTQVSKMQGVSRATQVEGIVDARNALDDIGAKPSDLLQSNYIVWVEGPSDRVYVNYWLSKIEPTLREGIHYSVMIYGGKLLNACSASASSKDDDLISLFRVNTHFCVLMDSDRAKRGARLNATKLRIREECENSGNMSWVTDGRTIENYVPADILRKAINELYPNNEYDQRLGDQYTCPLGGNFRRKSYGPDKISVARKVTAIGYELSPELRKHVEDLVKAIKLSNGL